MEPAHRRGGGAQTPSDASDGSDAGGAWWLPQPRPSLDEGHVEWRPAAPLAQALQCSVCGDLLKEAMTAAECGHAYCYDCIDDAVTVGGRGNRCPVCGVVLGPNPFEHGKLKYDFMLDALVRKVFPRPLLDAALEARRLEREEETRRAKANLQRRPARAPRAGGGAQPGGAGAHAGAPPAAAPLGGAGGAGDPVAVALFPLPPAPVRSVGDALGGSAALPGLAKPYITAPGGTTLGAVRAWLADRLAGRRGDASLQLLCAGRLIYADMTLQQLRDIVWRPHCARAAAAAAAAAAGGAGAGAGAGAAAPGGGEAGGGGGDVGGAAWERVMLVHYRPDSPDE
ncbi:DRIP1 [Scenedesmus sp. PABB004]|nr:DRIP1 [Scenedesmus sp. PABB004]